MLSERGNSPSDPTTVYVGNLGESTLCSADAYIGVGVYRSPMRRGRAEAQRPLNKDSGGSGIF